MLPLHRKCGFSAKHIPVLAQISDSDFRVSPPPSSTHPKAFPIPVVLRLESASRAILQISQIIVKHSFEALDFLHVWSRTECRSHGRLSKIDIPSPAALADISFVPQGPVHWCPGSNAFGRHGSVPGSQHLHESQAPPSSFGLPER